MKYFYLVCILFILNSLQINAQTLNSIESVEYDASQNRFLISNGNSIIARSSDGNLIFFGTGSASHGMEVLGDHLFAIDGSTIRGYELVSENEVMALSIPGAGFLNGMTNDGDSLLYVTDFSTDKIIRINVADLANPASEVIVQNTGSTPNGIVFDGTNNRLIFVSWGSNAPIKAVNLADNSVSTITTTSYGNIDGIDEDNDGNYYISTWSPDQIIKFDNTFMNPVSVTTPFLNNPADIGYALATDTLAIPHYPAGGDEVVYVGFEVISSVDILSDDFELNVFPNPVNETSVIQFSLKEKTNLNISIIDNKGSVVKTLLNGTQHKGEHKISFAGINLPTGIYYCKLQSEDILKTIKISIE